MNRKLHNVFYNLHGKVTIHISTINRNMLEGYNQTFRQFKSAETPGSQQYLIRDYSSFQLPSRFFYMNTEHIGFVNGFCLPNDRYAVVVNDDGITEYTNADCIAPNFWLQFILLRQNLCMIHGAGIELNGKGIIISSFSGAGKTTLVAHLQNMKGFRYFTDEFVIIDKNKTMFSYPCDISIFQVHLDLFPELHAPLFQNYFKDRKRKIQIIEALEKIPIPPFLHKIKKFSLFTLSRFVAGPAFLKVPATDLINRENFGTETKVDVALFLTRYNGENISFEEIELNLFIDKIIRMLSLEFREKLIYLLFLSVCDIITPAAYEKRQKEILSAALSQVKVFEVFVPNSMDPQLFSDSVKHFLDTVGK